MDFRSRDLWGPWSNQGVGSMKHDEARILSPSPEGFGHFWSGQKRGDPPTERNARTGELTPPGINFFARSKSSSDWFMFLESSVCVFLYDGHAPSHSEGEGSGLETGGCLFALVLVQVDQADDPPDGLLIESLGD